MLQDLSIILSFYIIKGRYIAYMYIHCYIYIILYIYIYNIYIHIYIIYP